MHALPGLAPTPVDGRHDNLRVDALAVLNSNVQQRVKQAVAQEVWFEVEQARVLGVVVVVVLEPHNRRLYEFLGVDFGW